MLSLALLLLLHAAILHNCADSYFLSIKSSRKIMRTYSTPSKRLDLPRELKPMRTCKVCKCEYDPSTNTDKSCRYHSGAWVGEENSNLFGTRSGGTNVGTTFFWNCCEEVLQYEFVAIGYLVIVMYTYLLFI